MAIQWLLVWCFVFGTYLIFAGTLSVSELLTGVVVSALATVWAGLISASPARRFSAAKEQIRPALVAVAALFMATVRTGGVLAKVAVRGGSPGRSVRSRFRFGPREDPRARSRRAIAVLCASLAPNRFVVEVERSRGEALLHAVDMSAAPNSEWLQ